MTGPTGPLLSSGEPVSHFLSLPLELDHDTRDILTRNTVDLHDGPTVWPSRSLERRRAFQHLLNRRVAIAGRYDESALTSDPDITDRSSTGAKILFVRRPHVSAARKG